MTGNGDFCLFFGVIWHYDEIKMHKLIEKYEKQSPLKVSE